MEKRTLYSALKNHLNDYKKKHIQTVDIDLKIMERLSRGQSEIQISMEIPCDISTVYRSINRVKAFLSTDSICEEDITSYTVTKHRAIIHGRIPLKTATSYKLFTLFIARHQAGYNSMSRNGGNQIMPGLRNKKQRDEVIAELNALIITTAEEPPQAVKIFECVKYEKAEYSFELTHQAYPYFYPLYDFLGRHPKLPPNLL